MGYKIPVYKPSLSGNEKKYVNDCLDSEWISSKGKYISLFEDKFRNYVGVKYATAVSNGTAALHLALVTLGICEGDEVIVPTFTYIASVSSIVYTGATPVFVDSDKSDWQMSIEDLKAKITPKTKAIMVVHLYGHPNKMDEIMKIANDNNLLVIEDCAESFGSTYKGKHTGTFGNIAAFSFYGNKIITTGEGGMMVTNDYSLYNKAYHLKMHGVSSEHYYWHDVIGYNYRMTNICGALGLAQLERADEVIEQKKQLAKKYNELLAGLPLTFQPELEGTTNAHWMFTILVNTAKTRDELRDYLDTKSIETRPTFYPVHTMPMFSNQHNKFPIAEDIALRGINLPSYPTISNEDLNYICNEIKNFFKERNLIN